jgi:hypothetical protein
MSYSDPFGRKEFHRNSIGFHRNQFIFTGKMQKTGQIPASA